MSVQTVSRIAVLLAADAKMLESFSTEEGRETVAHYYRHQLEGEESELILEGDMNAIFEYIRLHLPKPVNGEEPGG